MVSLLVPRVSEQLLKHRVHWYGLIPAESESEAVIERQFPHVTGPREGGQLRVAEEAANWRGGGG